jgi:geranylgeranyl reductase family protein
MAFDYDVIVVGGGPAGSSAGRFCSRAGLKTLLIEKERFPRYKVCGGCLSVKASRLLDFDLRPVIENTVTGARIKYPLEDQVLLESSEPIGFMVMRDRFDHLLVEKAMEQGTEVLEGEKVVRVRETDSALEVELGKGQRLRCEYLIGADGSGSVVSKAFSKLRLKDNGTGIGLESEVSLHVVTDFPQEDRHIVNLYFGRIPNGYGWVFPKKEGLSIGIGGIFGSKGKSSPRDYFDAFLKGLNFINGNNMGKVLGHPLPCFCDEKAKLSYRNVLLVGDAGHLMDPLTGEGIYYAVRSGTLAAEAIVQSKEKGGEASAPYQDSVRQLLIEDLKWARHLSQIIYGFTALSYRTLKQHPELGTLCLGVLAGETNYASFVSKVKERMKGLVKGRFGEKIRNAVSKSRPA